MAITSEVDAACRGKRGEVAQACSSPQGKDEKKVRQAANIRGEKTRKDCLTKVEAGKQDGGWKRISRARRIEYQRGSEESADAESQRTPIRMRRSDASNSSVSGVRQKSNARSLRFWFLAGQINEDVLQAVF